MKYGFIGCGQMGGALARSAASSLGGGAILLADKAKDKAEALASELGAESAELLFVAEKSDILFLGVKPQVMPDMLAEIRGVLAERKDRFVLVTMAAGLSVERIRGMAGDYPIIRIMPNLAVTAGAGMILYCSENCREEDLEAFLASMKNAGRLMPIDEKLIDAASAISGCGPAYVCLFAEALADGGVAAGIPRAQALELAEQTILGTAKLLLESGQHPGALKDAVCSPGGTTIAGVLALENGGFRGTVSEAVLAAYEKTLKLR